MAFFRALFAARTDVYAVRWEDARSGKPGWMPAVRGSWRKGIPAAGREYLLLTEEVITTHLSGDTESGCIRCWMVIAAGGWQLTSTVSLQKTSSGFVSELVSADLGRGAV